MNVRKEQMIERIKQSRIKREAERVERELAYPDQCSYCSGSGYIPDHSGGINDSTCEPCNGTGIPVKGGSMTTLPGLKPYQASQPEHNSYLNDEEETIPHTVWTGMEEHDSFNMNCTPAFEKSESDFSQTITYLQENRYAKEEFFTPEDKDPETEYVNNDVPNQEKVRHWTEDSKNFATKEQRQSNYERCLKLIKEAKTAAKIGYAAHLVIKEIDASKANSSNGEIPTLFPAGKLKEFWAIYRELKAELQHEEDQIIKEIKANIKDAQGSLELFDIRGDIKKASISYSEKEKLWKACDTRFSA